MRIERIATLAVMTAAALLAGCNEERPHGNDAGGDCQGCHGGQSGLTGLAAAAPPFDTRGETDSIQAGSHTKHLAAGIACDTCHVVPANANAPGHMSDETEGQAELTFGDAASAQGAQPTYGYTSHTCSNTYCHAPRTPGGQQLVGADNAPVWNGPARACTDCHGYPPLALAPHGPGSTDCSSCHPDTVEENDQAIKAGGKHMNGVPDTNMTSGCTGCHGDPNRTVVDARNTPAPPRDTAGETASAQVGAHQVHLEGRGTGAIAKPFRCEECHVYPGDISHADSRPAELTFGGPVGTAVGRTPTYTAGTRTCTNTYCHAPTVLANGQPLDLGGTNRTPAWAGGASQAACGTCHGRPPPAPHPQVDLNGSPFSATSTAQCSQCHPATVNEDGTIFASNGAHVNGQLDVDNYHPAGFVNPAVHGRAANFHDLAAFPQGLASCKTCHGNDLNGGIVGVSCNACHASAGHPSWQTQADGCNFCHGSSTSRGTLVATAMPPVDTLGRTAPTDPVVGAHQTHLSGRSTGAISDGVACTDCHTTVSYDSIDHVDGAVQIALKQAGTSTVRGTYDSATGTCSSVYCHGNLLRNGEAGNDPLWTTTSGQTDCGTCHASQTPSGTRTDRHATHMRGTGNFPNLTCANCHGTGYLGSATTAPSIGTGALPTHVNGTVNVTGYGYNPTTHGCSTAGCHGSDDRWY